VDIGTDGTITLRPMGQQPTELAVLDRIKLVKPPTRDLLKDSEGLFRLANGGQAPADASVTLVSGAIEGSNVNTAAELVEIINLARQFEFQVKVMSTAEDNEAATTQMLRLA
jgi:flagellar basal-body rod protein FlgF